MWRSFGILMFELYTNSAAFSEMTAANILQGVRYLGDTFLDGCEHFLLSECF